MKWIFFVLTLSSSFAFAENYHLEKGTAVYTVKHTLKKVQGTSDKVKGKVRCLEERCEFLLAVEVKTFTSSDSNRDLNMRQTIESDKFPVASAKGTFDLTTWQTMPKISAEVDFHGVKKAYDLHVTHIDELHKKAHLVLDLEAHNVERPSLFTMKIDNEVPLDFDLVWKKELKN